MKNVNEMSEVLNQPNETIARRNKKLAHCNEQSWVFAIDIKNKSNDSGDKMNKEINHIFIYPVTIPFSFL